MKRKWPRILESAQQRLQRKFKNLLFGGILLLSGTTVLEFSFSGVVQEHTVNANSYGRMLLSDRIAEAVNNVSQFNAGLTYKEALLTLPSFREGNVRKVTTSMCRTKQDLYDPPWDGSSDDCDFETSILRISLAPKSGRQVLLNNGSVATMARDVLYEERTVRESKHKKGGDISLFGVDIYGERGSRSPVIPIWSEHRSDSPGLISRMIIKQDIDTPGGRKVLSKSKNAMCFHGRSCKVICMLKNACTLRTSSGILTCSGHEMSWSLMSGYITATHTNLSHCDISIDVLPSFSYAQPPHSQYGPDEVVIGLATLIGVSSGLGGTLDTNDLSSLIFSHHCEAILNSISAFELNFGYARLFANI